VEYPHCHLIHGGHWKIDWVLLASLFLNALSFFLTMRPKLALVWTIGFLALGGFLLAIEEQ
jgi:hypothetical protein